MEKALLHLRDGDFGTTEHIHAGWELVTEYPLSPELLAMSNVWRSPDGGDYIIAAKGAPEAIFDLCHLGEVARGGLAAPVDVMAAQGLRVLGMAKASFSEPDLPGVQHDFAFTFLGFVGFADPVRPQVAEAVKECDSAGIRVIMITGDYPLTAQNIGRQVGLSHPERGITGAELDTMSDEELRQRIGSVAIFARAVPEQKLRIVDALKAGGEVVAMTGDGVNDAPALKSADIGIAMGGRGTDVARESSSLVLLDDNFTSIVSAVRLGRRIFDNLKKAMAYIISVHIPIAGMSLIPVLFSMPLVLLPVHIVFLELIIDPACSIVFESEKEERNVMNRPPRRKDEGPLHPADPRDQPSPGAGRAGRGAARVRVCTRQGHGRGRSEDPDVHHHRDREPRPDPDKPVLVRDHRDDAAHAQPGDGAGVCRDDRLPAPRPPRAGLDGTIPVRLRAVAGARSLRRRRRSEHHLVRDLQVLGHTKDRAGMRNSMLLWPELPEATGVP